MIFTKKTFWVILSILSFSNITAAVYTADQKSSAVDEHNNVRSSTDPVAVDMEKMEWDGVLGMVAQNYSDQCIFEHNSDRTSQAGGKYSYVGENLYISSGTPSNFASASVISWASEVEDYDFDTNSCSSVCGHYTQVVWASSSAVGCGHTVCESVEGLSDSFNEFCNSYGCTLIVCNYGPGGNYANTSPYTSGDETCSQCPDDKPYCDGGLCSDQSAQNHTEVQTGCIDDPDGIVAGVGETCADQESCETFDADFEGHAVYIWELCPATCGKCNVTVASNTEGCEDDPEGIMAAGDTTCEEKLSGLGGAEAVCDNFDADYDGYQRYMWQLCPLSCDRCNDPEQYVVPDMCEDESDCDEGTECRSPDYGSYCGNGRKLRHTANKASLRKLAFGNVASGCFFCLST